MMARKIGWSFFFWGMKRSIALNPVLISRENIGSNIQLFYLLEKKVSDDKGQNQYMS